MGDVALGVELGVVIDPALDLPAVQSCGDCVHAGEERVVLFVGFETPVEDLFCSFGELAQYPPGPVGDLIAHEDADLVELLPFAVEFEQGADLEVAGRYVEGAGDLAPLAEIVGPPPTIDTVVDDEQGLARGL